MAICSGTKSLSEACRVGVAEHELRLLAVGFVDQLDAPPLERHRRAQLERVGGRGGGGRQAVEGLGQRAASASGSTSPVKAKIRFRPPKWCLKCAAVSDAVAAVERGRQAIDRMAVGVLAVDIAQEEALAELAIVVAVLGDLPLDLLARAGKFGGIEGGPDQDVGDERQDRRRGCGPAPRLRSGSCPARCGRPACRPARRTPRRARRATGRRRRGAPTRRPGW